VRDAISQVNGPASQTNDRGNTSDNKAAPDHPGNYGTWKNVEEAAPASLYMGEAGRRQSGPSQP